MVQATELHAVHPRLPCFLAAGWVWPLGSIAREKKEEGGEWRWEFIPLLLLLRHGYNLSLSKGHCPSTAAFSSLLSPSALYELCPLPLQDWAATACSYWP